MTTFWLTLEILLNSIFSHSVPQKLGPHLQVTNKGCDIACEIEPGFHTTKTITLAVPKIDHDERKFYLVLESVIDGKTVFHSEETCLNVIAPGIVRVAPGN